VTSRRVGRSLSARVTGASGGEADRLHRIQLSACCWMCAARWGRLVLECCYVSRKAGICQSAFSNELRWRGADLSRRFEP
jgi:hypothetical protein